MNPNLQFHLPRHGSIIKVMGVGGGGGNAVTTMFQKGIKGVDFVICNTDKQVLDRSPIPTKIRLGEALTQGLGCGANPEIGRQSALESIEQIRSILADNTKMVFITAGMGGGTGTGAGPIIAQLAREMGILTVGICTTPFTFEGEWRMKIAMEGIAELEKHVDSLLVVKNANLLAISPKNIKQKEAFLKADEVLSNAAKGIAEIITVDGYINVDFADVQTVMRNSGTALMGTATVYGEHRAKLAVEEALNSPLLDHVDVGGASGALVNITASEDSLTLEEVETIGNTVQQAVGPFAKIIIGQVFNDDMGENLSLTVIATGFDKKKKEQPKAVAVPAVAPVVAATPATPVTPASPEVPRNTVKPVQGTLGIEVEEVNEPYRPPQLQPREELVRAMSLEERMRRMETTTFDLRNPQNIKQLEEVPAYMRRQGGLDANASANSPRSRTSVGGSTDANGRFTLRDNNSYLYDNVD